jgi:hypothetical protein
MDIKGILIAVVAGLLALALVGYLLIPGTTTLTLD